MTGLGPIYPRGLSNAGPASTVVLNEIPVGAIYTTDASGLQNLVFDPTTHNVGPTPTAFGPYIWGLRRSANDIVRFEENQGIIDVIEMNDVGPEATLPNQGAQGGLVVDATGDAWTIELTSNVLVQVQGEKPQVIATYAIPNVPKTLLAYDSVQNTIILLGADTGSGQPTLAIFDIGAKTFGADVAVGATTDTFLSLFYTADANATDGGYVFVGGNNGTSSNLYKVEPVTLATTGTLAIAGATPVRGYTYVTFGPSTAVLVVSGAGAATDLSAIDPVAFTLDAGSPFAVPTANTLFGIAHAGPTVWAADTGDSAPSVVHEVSVTSAGAFTYVNSYPLSTTVNGDSISTVFDTTNNLFWISSDNLDELYSVTTTGALTGTNELAGITVPIAPGPVGQVLTSQGPGRRPIWAAGGGGGGATGATGPTGATGTSGATGATGSAPTTVGDNWKGRRWVLNKGARRPGNAAISSFYAPGAGAMKDIDIIFPGNTTTSFGAGEYVAVVDSGVTGSPVTVLNHTTGAVVASLPNGGGSLTANGYDRIAYVGGSSYISGGAVLSDYLFIVQSQVAVGPKMAAVNVTNGGSNVATLTATGPLSHLYFDGSDIFFTDANGALWLTAPYSGFAGATQIQPNGTFDAACQYMISDGTYLYIPQPTTNRIARIGPNYSTNGAPVSFFSLGVGSGPLGITYDGRYLWITLSTGATSFFVVQVDPVNDSVVSTRQSGAAGGSVQSIIFDGDSVWSSASAFNIASTNPQLFSNDPDQVYGGGFGGIQGEYNAFNLPARIAPRGTPAGAWIYVLCTGDNTIKVLKNDQFPA